MARLRKRRRDGGDPGSRAEGGRTLSPLDRYFIVLEAIAGMPAARLSDLAVSCNIPISSIHRMVNTLVASGLLMVSDHGRKGYELGPRLLRLVHTGSDEAWIKIVGQKILDELAKRSGETCYMTKLIGRQVISVAWATPPHGLKAYVVPGLTQPLHAAASAKAILAFQDQGLIRSLLDEPLPKLCANTKTSFREVLKELTLVRQCGFATCVNENEAGIAAVACPIYLAGGQVIYSIGMTGVVDRFPPAKLQHWAKLLREVAVFLSATIKDAPPQQKAAE